MLLSHNVRKFLRPPPWLRLIRHPVRTHHFPVCLTEPPDRTGEIVHLRSAVDQQRSCHIEVTRVRLVGNVQMVAVSHHPYFSLTSLRQWYYHEISGDGRLLHPVEGTLRRGAGLEVKYGLHQRLADVRVPTSHHEELLVGFVILWFLGAHCLINGWSRHGGVEAFRVAGVGNVGRVWGSLRMENISQNKWLSIVGPMIEKHLLMFYY